jgi:hypothetical protein
VVEGASGKLGVSAMDQNDPMQSASLDILLNKLLSPLTAEEQLHGWTSDAKAGLAGYIRAKKEELRAQAFGS